jgi:hypothetical protein
VDAFTDTFVWTFSAFTETIRWPFRRGRFFTGPVEVSPSLGDTFADPFSYAFDSNSFSVVDAFSDTVEFLFTYIFSGTDKCHAAAVLDAYPDTDHFFSTLRDEEEEKEEKEEEKEKEEVKEVKEEEKEKEEKEEEKQEKEEKEEEEKGQETPQAGQKGCYDGLALVHRDSRLGTQLSSFCCCDSTTETTQGIPFLAPISSCPVAESIKSTITTHLVSTG